MAAIGTMGAIWIMGTMENGKNFYKNFDESREISKRAIRNMGAIGTMGNIGTLKTMENGNYRNFGEIIERTIWTLVKIEKIWWESRKRKKRLLEIRSAI